MRQMQMMAIYDKALGAYMQPWFAQSKGQAQRMFQDELGNPQGGMHKHPDDYDLYFLGEWNSETGHLTQPDKPILLAQGSNLKQQ